MTNKDILQKFLFENAEVRGNIVRLHKSFQTIIQQHDYPSAVKRILGEALVAANLLSATIKFKGRMTLQFKGKHNLRLLLVQCSHDFNFRGLAQWEGNPSYADIISSLKENPLAITIEPDGAGKQRYQGIVEWQGDSFVKSIEGYFKHSEQLPTRVWLAINDASAAGLLLQKLPTAGSDQDKDWEHIVHITKTVKTDELLNCDTITLLHRLYHQEELRLFEPQHVNFRCSCSLKRSENAIVLLGLQEAEEELKNNKSLVVTCDFCNSQYSFDHVDVTRIFKQNDSKPQIH